jgi:regulator of sigma E protease
MAGKAVESGLFSYITFIAVLSAQIGFINLLPIPVLDGGYLLFYLYEALARKPVPEKVKEISLIGGLIFLFVLMIVANISDILRVTHL